MNNKFFGVDNCLDISLFEYGFIANKPDEYKDEYFIVYKKREGLFDTAYVREGELDKLIKGEEWADNEDIINFLFYLDISKEEWLKQPFVNKLSNVIGYFDKENVFGSSYYGGITRAEVEAKYLTFDLF